MKTFCSEYIYSLHYQLDFFPHETSLFYLFIIALTIIILFKNKTNNLYVNYLI